MTNQSHFFSYSAICIFLVISVLLCVFNQEVKSCCAFMCRKKKYVPEVAYNVETDDVTVIERTEPASKLVRLNISDVFENHSDSEGLGTTDPLTIESSRAHLQPEKVKIKRTAPTPSQPKLKPGTSSRLARTNTALGPSAALALQAETQPKLKVQQPADGIGEFPGINKKSLTGYLQKLQHMVKESNCEPRTDCREQCRTVI